MTPIAQVGTEELEARVDLAPCPFCGGEAIEYPWPAGTIGIMCDNSECAVHVEVEAAPREEAIAAWNTRSLPPSDEGSPNSHDLALIECAIREKVFELYGHLLVKGSTELAQAALTALTPLISKVRGEALEEAAKVADKVAFQQRVLRANGEPNNSVTAVGFVADQIRAIQSGGSGT